MTVTTHGVVVGRVLAVRDHPRGHRIWLADVDLGGGQVVQIVWGGKRIVRPNSLVPVAPPGSRLNGTKMRRRTYRGHRYHMECFAASQSLAGIPLREIA